MTFQDLFDTLKSMQRLTPEKMGEEIVFLDNNQTPRQVNCAEYNDGSVDGVGKGSLFLSEV